VDSTQIFVRTSREHKTNKYSDTRPRVENVSRYAGNTFIVDEKSVLLPLPCNSLDLCFRSTEVP